MRRRRKALLATALLFSGMLGTSPVVAAESGSPAPLVQTKKSKADRLISEATAEVRLMKADSKLTALIARAKGIYLVPVFRCGALIVGGRLGAGIVLAKHDGQWTDPAFYDFRAVSIGPQLGGSAGEMAFLLMDDHAVDAFKNRNKLSLDTNAEVSIPTYSAGVQASLGEGHVVVWLHTAGAYAGATVGVTDLNWATAENHAFYGRKVEPSQVFVGGIEAPGARSLKSALAG